MTKYDFVVHHTEYNDFLEEVRNIGVLHIATLDQANDMYEKLRDKYNLLSRIEQNISVCQQLISIQIGMKKNGIKAIEATSKNLEIEQGLSLINQFEELQKTKENLTQNLNASERELLRMDVWGDISNETIEKLRTNGLIINFFSCPTRAWKEEWESEYNAFIINNSGTTCFFITITRQPVETIEAEPFIISELSTAQLREAVEQNKTALTLHETKMTQFAIDNINNLKHLLLQANDEINIEKVHLNTQIFADNTIMVLEGYCPETLEKELDSLLEGKGIYYEKSAPEAEDNVPIKLHNNWFARMFESLTGMYGMPVYQEFDPTPILAPFFLLFFAMCMGDAGYGILLIIFGLALKSGKIKIEMFDGLGAIITTLGVGTAIIGFFLGTAFGVDLYSASWMPESLKQVMIKGEIQGFDIQMILAIIIGIFHICLAMVIKAIGYTKRWGISKSISTWGWLLLIVGGLSTILLAVGNLVSATAAQYVLIGIGSISALCIYIFNDPKRNVFINIGAGLWDTYNMATGLLGDTLSYIRLYALGLAGGMLGGAFNDLGAMVLGDEPSLLSWIPYILILAFGHLLNLAMSALGAFVHPLRLTFVEYFKNAGYEGKGEKYSPLAKTAE